MTPYQNRKKKKSLLPIVMIVILGGAFYLFMTYHDCTSKVLFETDTTFEVKEGMTFSTLVQNDSCPFWVSKIYLRENTPNFQLQKGMYSIQSGTTLSTFISQLQKPLNNDIKITLLEGWNRYDIDVTLTKKGLIKKGEFLAYISNNLDIFKKEYSFLEYALSLEGFLYPDTYYINPNNFKLESFTKMLLDNFEKKVVQNIDFGNNKNIYQVINLASIVEKEEKVPTEKANVAGVLKKRIREGWMIGADATVCYPFKTTSDECTPSFILEKLYEKNEYNTRTMFGLPKTPIANPSFETIQATLDGDESTPYYFYLHDSKGGIHYARTNAEHEENKRKYIYGQ